MSARVDKVLAVLTKGRLAELGHELAVALPVSATKEAQIERLIRAAEPTMATLARFFTRDELKAVLRDLTFPFPQPDPRAVIAEVASIGQTLYEARAAYMLDSQQGLTQTCNLLKDPACTDPRIAHLRALHLDLDRAVLAAYSWRDIPVPPYTTRTTPAESAALQTFEDSLIERLFILNSARASKQAEAPRAPIPKRRTSLGSSRHTKTTS